MTRRIRLGLAIAAALSILRANANASGDFDPRAMLEQAWQVVGGGHESVPGSALMPRQAQAVTGQPEGQREKCCAGDALAPYRQLFAKADKLSEPVLPATLPGKRYFIFTDNGASWSDYPHAAIYLDLESPVPKAFAFAARVPENLPWICAAQDLIALGKRYPYPLQLEDGELRAYSTDTWSIRGYDTPQKVRWTFRQLDDSQHVRTVVRHEICDEGSPNWKEYAYYVLWGNASDAAGLERARCDRPSQ